jgi:hypothetical protein
MGIKEVLLKKRLLKNANPIDMVFAERVYSMIEELVGTEYAGHKDKVKAELTVFTNDFYARFKEMAKTVTEQVSSDTKTSKKEAIEAIASMLIELKTFKSDCIALIEQRNREIVSETNTKVARITANIEDFRGPQGIAGKPGEKGADGSPDTAKQVVEKVNTIGGVKISAIEGLTDALKKAKKEGGGGKSGGGMGNMQHETKNVSSGTTSVTTTYGIAAGGRAIWVYFQGQGLAYGTHFTVSGKTINLLFTPVDSTALDIIYVRA